VTKDFVKLAKYGAGGIRTPGAFRHNGFQDRRPEIINTEKADTSNLSGEPLTPQWTPESPTAVEIDASEPPSDLAQIVQNHAALKKVIEAWPRLSDDIRTAILRIAGR